MLLLLVHII